MEKELRYLFLRAHILEMRLNCYKAELLDIKSEDKSFRSGTNVFRVTSKISHIKDEIKILESIQEKLIASVCKSKKRIKMSLLYKPKARQTTKARISQLNGEITIEFSADCGKFGTEESLADFTLTPETLFKILINHEDYEDNQSH